MSNKIEPMRTRDNVPIEQGDFLYSFYEGYIGCRRTERYSGIARGTITKYEVLKTYNALNRRTLLLRNCHDGSEYVPEINRAHLYSDLKLVEKKCKDLLQADLKKVVEKEKQIKACVKSMRSLLKNKGYIKYSKDEV